MCLKGSAEIRSVLRGKVHILKEKSAPRLQEKGVTPTKAEQNIAADKGYDGLYLVKVGAIPDEYIVPTDKKIITENGTYDAKNWLSAEVNVESGGGSSGESLVTLSGSYMLGGSGSASNTNYGVHPYTFNIKEAVNGTVNGSTFDYIEVSGCGGDSCPEQPFTSIRFTKANGDLVDSFMSYDLVNSGVGFTVSSATRVTALFYSVLTGMMA